MKAKLLRDISSWREMIAHHEEHGSTNNIRWLRGFSKKGKSVSIEWNDTQFAVWIDNNLITAKNYDSVYKPRLAANPRPRGGR